MQNPYIFHRMDNLTMNINTEQEFTFELKKVVSYLLETLLVEFPSSVITPEHLMVSILETKNCHANMLIYSLLKDEDADTLKRAYMSVIEEHAEKGYPQRTAPMALSDELEDIMSAADVECSTLTPDAPVGTEHVLLAALNNSNKLSITKVLENAGLRYSDIKNMLAPKKEKKKTVELKPADNNIPPKGQISAKTVAETYSTPKFVDAYTVNINQMAKENKLDRLIGRDTEVKQAIRALARRKKNNVILVGDGGCGTTSIVYGIAQMIENKEVPSFLEEKQIVKLDTVSLVSGTNFRGMLEERINGLFKELKGRDRYILFLDDIQSILNGGSRDTDSDLSSFVGTLLSDGNVCVIGTTTSKGYKKAVDSNPQISRKFQKIIVSPATEEQAVNMLEANKGQYEAFHCVKYPTDVIRKIVRWAERYITSRKLPDSAFDVLDVTGAMVGLSSNEGKKISEAKKELKTVEAKKSEMMNNGNWEAIDGLTRRENELRAVIAEEKRENIKKNKRHTVTQDDAATAVSEMTGIPIGRLNASEKSALANIDNILMKSIVGQDEAIRAVCRVIKRNRVGLGDRSKTQGVFLCCGPSGVGKTLLAKKLAEEIYGDKNALVRIDMSEYSEKNSVSKLTGAAPGYVGYENGGQLTEAVKNRQYCVLLLDEMEKADQEVYNVFLQLFDDGRLTDSSGQVVNFKNIIVIMTSNVGAREASEFGNGIGFTPDSQYKKNFIEKKVKSTFSPEFLNRIDKIVYFNPLTSSNLRDIVRLEMGKLETRIGELGYKLKYNDKVVDAILNGSKLGNGMGARPLIREIQARIEDKVTDLLLENDYRKNHAFKVDVKDGDIVVI
jgi:ATP-dependent Clp protease ATP-binding subunit ClpC